LDTENPKNDLTVANISMLVGIASTLVAIRGFYGKDALKCFIPGKKGMLMNIGSGFVLTAATIPLIALLTLLCRAIIPSREQPILRALRQDYTTGLLIQADLVALVTAPVYEELFFRGILYRALRQKFTVPVALLIQGLLFGLMHGDPALILPLSVSGIAFGAMYEKTQSLVTPIAGHMLFNFLNVSSIVYGLG
jgi:membrane protease YdiL (CAAX protease family)